MLIHITWACYVHCQWSVDQCLPCSAASNIELRASINDSWLAYHQFPFQVSRNAAATTLDFGVGGFKGFSTSCKWWDISLDVPNTSPACRVTGVLRTFPLEVEEDQLMKEAPCHSMQMHEDVVHCSPDGLLPGGGGCIRSQACNCCQGRSPPFPASQAASTAAQIGCAILEATKCRMFCLIPGLVSQGTMIVICIYLLILIVQSGEWFNKQRRLLLILVFKLNQIMNLQTWCPMAK